MGNLSPIAHATAGRSTDFAPGNIAVNSAAWSYSGDNGTKATIVTDLDRAGGGFRMTMDGTNNDCETVFWGGETIDPTAVGNRFGFEAVILGTEVDTDDADRFIGFSDVTGNTFFGDDDTLASMDAFGFYKITGSLFFRTCALNATEQSGSTTTTAWASGVAYRVRMECEVGTAGITARYYVDGVLIEEIKGITITDTGLMHPVVALSADGAHAENIDVYQFTPYSIQA
jgi:hypothetical protein